MNAHTRNTAERLLFSNGGRLDVILDGERQSPEAQKREEEEAHKIMMRGLREFGTIKECPFLGEGTMKKNQNAKKPEAELLSKVMPQFRVTQDVYQSALRFKRKHGVSMTTLVQTALEEYLTRLHQSEIADHAARYFRTHDPRPLTQLKEALDAAGVAFVSDIDAIDIGSKTLAACMRRK